MQQFFIDHLISVGDEYVFTKEQKHHAKTVVRLENEIVRLVYDGKGFYAKAYTKGDDFVAEVIEEDTIDRELPIHFVLAVALIRKEKFELVLQKACELGVTEIIPFTSKRCVVQAKKDKSDRYNQILKQAAEQCKRDRVPVIRDVIDIKDLHLYKQECNLLAFEKENIKGNKLHDVIQNQQSIMVVIGPEGGFEQNEVDALMNDDFNCISLGRRILRAETAAMYACAIVSEMTERAQ